VRQERVNKWPSCLTATVFDDDDDDDRLLVFSRSSWTSGWPFAGRLSAQDNSNVKDTCMTGVELQRA
jgi:hypothetical protein